jgi:hypothetical protein
MPNQIPIESEVPQFIEEKERYIEIYKITNIITDKIYIGQAVSHILNHGKYRRYGAKKRFDTHVSEAMKNNKDKECRYLNNSIRKHGVDKFIVEIIDVCSMVNNDETEANYIEKYNSVFPFGYNLKIGGTVFKHSDESRRILAESYVKSLNGPKAKPVNILSSVELNKLERFNDIDLPDNIDDHEKNIRIANCLGKNLVVLKIGEIELSFGSKKKTVEQLKTDAIEFVKKLKKYKEERNNPAKLLDVPEKPHSNDNFADNDGHIASKDEYIKSIENYKLHLKQKKDKKKFNYICRVCNIQKTSIEFRGKHHICKPCEILDNKNRNKKIKELNKDEYNAKRREYKRKNRDKINERRRELAKLKKNMQLSITTIPT